MTILRFLSLLILLHYCISRLLVTSWRARRWLKKELKQIYALGYLYQIHILNTIGGFYEILRTWTLRIFSHYCDFLYAMINWSPLLPLFMAISSFFLCLFLSYSDLCLSTHCRCGGLLLYLITHSVGLLWTGDRPVAKTSDKRKHSQVSDIHVPRGIRTRNPNN